MVGLAHAAGHLVIRSSMEDRGAQFNWRVAREWVWSRPAVMSKHASLVFRIDRDSRCWNGNTLILRRRQPRQGKRVSRWLPDFVRHHSVKSRMASSSAVARKSRFTSLDRWSNTARWLIYPLSVISFWSTSGGVASSTTRLTAVLLPGWLALCWRSPARNASRTDASAKS